MLKIFVFFLINVGFLLVFPPLIFVLSIGLFALCITQITKNIFSALILAALCIPSLIGFVSVAIEIFSPNQRQFFYIYTAFLFINVLVAVYCIRNKISKPILFERKLDLAAAAVFLTILLVLVIPFLIGTPVEKFVLASTGWDAGNHFMLFNYNLINEGPSYLNSDARMLDVLRRYPQGLHTSLAVIIGKMPEGQLINKITAYYFFSVFYCGVMMFFFTQILSASRLNVFVVALLGFSLWPLVGVPLMYGGFFTQIAGMAYLFAFMCVLIFSDSNKMPLIQKLLLGLLLAGVSMSWYIFLIVPFFVIASRLSYSTVEVKRNKWFFLFGSLFVIPIPLINLFSTNNDVMRLLPEKYASNSSTLLLPGGVYQYKMSAVLILAFVFLLMALYFKRNSFRAPRLPAALFWGYFAAFFILLSVSFYQLLTVGEFRYYAYKLVFLVIPFVVIVFSWTLSYLIESNFKLRLLMCAALVVPLIALSIKILFQDEVIRFWKNGNAGSFFSEYMLNQPHNENTIFVSKCNPNSAAIANNWLNAIHLNSTVEKRISIKKVTLDGELQQGRLDNVVSETCSSN